MDQIKERIQQTVDNLQEKKRALEEHKKSYIDLKFTLYDYDKYLSTDHPEITVQMTSKARVRARVIDPTKILAFLGCEYFVERTPKEAVEQVERKLKFLQKAIDEFDLKIKDAEKTMKNIDTLVEYQEKEESDKQEQVQKGEPAGVPLNEESLPFMDIREELDEDGNVVNSTVEVQNHDRLKEFGEANGVSQVDEDDELQELLRDMEITKKQTQQKVEPKIQEVVEPEVEEVKEESVVEDTIVERAVEDTIVERVVETPETEEEVKNEPKTQENDYFSLWKEMGIVNKSQTTEPPQPKTTSKETTREETTTEEVKVTVRSVSPEDTTEVDSTVDYEKFDPSLPAIEQDDIMQLQVIADELEEDGYEYGFDEDDDDDDDDWDFSYGEDNLVPESYRDLFAKELERVRAKKDKKEEELPTGVLKKEGRLKKKKSVAFAKELQIKEVENISEEWKAAQNSNASKFKLARGGSNLSTVGGNDDDDAAAPLNDIVERETVVSEIVEKEPPVADIVEKEGPVSDIVQKEVSAPEPKKQSKFKSSLQKSSAPIVTPVESTEEPEKPKRVSKFKSSLQKHSNPIPQVTTPEPRDEPEDPPKRISKFKSSLSKPSPPSNPTPVKVPQNTYDPTPEDVYNNIKAYALNEDDDEDMLNAITENLVVYNPEDEDEEDEDEEEEEDDGPMLLDEIVENEEVDDPNYYVDENIMAKEYYDLRAKMIRTYGEKQREAEERIIVKEDEGQELEPIDEHGNPVKVSRFRKSLGK